jgi:chorismate mutase
MDLQEVRVRLDQMTGRIVSRLKDRSRFPRNAPVYEAGAVPIAGRDGISFLQFALEGLELYHASLGRYNFPDQYPLLSALGLESPVTRNIPASAAPRVDIPITNDLLAFYVDMLERLCPAGEDPGTFGETVYVDADLLHLVHERINIGRYIAAAKFAADPGLAALVGDAARLSEVLRDRPREEALLGSVEAAANRYELDAEVAKEVFRWIIAETLALEVWYLQGIAARGELDTLLAGSPN